MWTGGRQKRKFRVSDFIFKVMTLKMHILLLVLTSILLDPELIPWPHTTATKDEE